MVGVVGGAAVLDGDVVDRRPRTGLQEGPLVRGGDLVVLRADDGVVDARHGVAPGVHAVDQVGVVDLLHPGFTDEVVQGRVEVQTQRPDEPVDRLDTLPRRRYTTGPTPVTHLRDLGLALGGPEIWIKRDDQLGLALGGNKTRKLEFLVADALTAGADTLITLGGVQSNHCRLTLAAARQEGLDCRLLLAEDLRPDATEGPNPPEFTGNFLLFDLLGADTEVHPHGHDLAGRAVELAAELTEEGRTPYIIPTGGSTATGALGYVDCAREILAQSVDLGMEWDAVVVASGSAGMQAGLVAGVDAAGADLPVVGVSVMNPQATQEEMVGDLADDVAFFLGAGPVPRDRVRVLDDYVGAGYTLPTDAMVEAVRLFATTEGVLLDPVYTGKAAAGLIDLVRRGIFAPDGKILFLHSGGVPGLFARAGYFE